MTIGEMHTEFKLLLDKVDGGGAPSFLSGEIDILLNSAIERFVSKRMYGNNMRRTSFEEDQKRRDDLRTLIRESKIPASDLLEGVKPNSKLAPLPSDYRHTIQEEVVLLVGDKSKRVAVKPITHDRYSKIIDDPFNTPDKNTVYRLDYGGSSEQSVEIIHANDVYLGEYYIRYIKNPVKVVNGTSAVSCDLAGHTHREIVRMAVVEALENIEDPRYQSSKIELNEIE